MIPLPDPGWPLESSDMSGYRRRKRMYATRQAGIGSQNEASRYRSEATTASAAPHRPAPAFPSVPFHEAEPTRRDRNQAEQRSSDVGQKYE